MNGEQEGGKEAQEGGGYIHMADSENMPLVLCYVCLGSESNCYKGNKMFITHLCLWTVIHTQ